MNHSVTRYLRGIFVLVIAVVILSGCEINSVSPAHAANPASWQIITSPSPGTRENSLKSISAVSATEMYAVGSTDDATFLLDGNGKTWTQDTSVNYTGKLYSVSADTQGDVYVTGGEAKQDNSTVAFLLYKLKGASTWTRADLPAGSSIGESIKAFSATQVWIVGSTYAHTPYGQGVAWLWNGSTFTPNAMPDPLPDTVQNLSAVTGTSASDVWMSGYTTGGVSFSAHLENGAWKPYPVPHPSTLQQDSYLMSLSSYGQDVWGVGRDTLGAQQVAYISHFTNGSWSTVYTSPTPSNYSYLSSVIQTSASDVWAVGNYVVNSQTEPLSLHSTDAGKTWNPVTVPNVDTLSELYSIVNVSGTLWAVGDSSHGGVTQKSLIEAYTSPAVPTPSPTPVSATTSNWAGYMAVTKESYIDVKVSWKVPPIKCGIFSFTEAKIWTGLNNTDGSILSPVEQVGINADCTSKQSSYQGWIEMAPKPAELLSKSKYPVKVGDQINGEVKYLGNNNFRLLLSNRSSSRTWSYSVIKTDNGAKRQGAECIVEAKILLAPLAQFSPITFTGCQVNNNPIGKSTSLLRITMVDGKVVRATPSNLLKLDTFTINWKHG